MIYLEYNTIPFYHSIPFESTIPFHHSILPFTFDVHRYLLRFHSTIRFYWWLHCSCSLPTTLPFHFYRWFHLRWPLHSGVPTTGITYHLSIHSILRFYVQTYHCRYVFYRPFYNSGFVHSDSGDLFCRFRVIYHSISFHTTTVYHSLVLSSVHSFLYCSYSFTFDRCSTTVRCCSFICSFIYHFDLSTVCDTISVTVDFRYHILPIPVWYRCCSIHHYRWHCFTFCHFTPHLPFTRSIHFHSTHVPIRYAFSVDAFHRLHSVYAFWFYDAILFILFLTIISVTDLERFIDCGLLLLSFSPPFLRSAITTCEHAVYHSAVLRYHSVTPGNFRLPFYVVHFRWNTFVLFAFPLCLRFTTDFISHDLFSPSRLHSTYRPFTCSVRHLHGRFILYTTVATVLYSTYYTFLPVPPGIPPLRSLLITLPILFTLPAYTLFYRYTYHSTDTISYSFIRSDTFDATILTCALHHFHWSIPCSWLRCSIHLPVLFLPTTVHYTTDSVLTLFHSTVPVHFCLFCWFLSTCCVLLYVVLPLFDSFHSYRSIVVHSPFFLPSFSFVHFDIHFYTIATTTHYHRYLLLFTFPYLFYACSTVTFCVYHRYCTLPFTFADVYTTVFCSTAILPFYRFFWVHVVAFTFTTVAVWTQLRVTACHSPFPPDVILYRTDHDSRTAPLNFYRFCLSPGLYIHYLPLPIPLLEFRWVFRWRSFMILPYLLLDRAILPVDLPPTHRFCWIPHHVVAILFLVVRPTAFTYHVAFVLSVRFHSVHYVSSVFDLQPSPFWFLMWPFTHLPFAIDSTPVVVLFPFGRCPYFYHYHFISTYGFGFYLFSPCTFILLFWYISFGNSTTIWFYDLIDHSDFYLSLHSFLHYIRLFHSWYTYILGSTYCLHFPTLPVILFCSIPDTVLQIYLTKPHYHLPFILPAFSDHTTCSIYFLHHWIVVLHLHFYLHCSATIFISLPFSLYRLRLYHLDSPSTVHIHLVNVVLLLGGTFCLPRPTIPLFIPTYRLYSCGMIPVVLRTFWRLPDHTCNFHRPTLPHRWCISPIPTIPISYHSSASWVHSLWSLHLFPDVTI